MITINTVLQIATIFLALAGAYLAARTSDLMKKKTDIKLLKAKAFLHDSFIKDIWVLLFIGCLLFLISATIHFDEMFGLLIDESKAPLLQDFILIGVMSCSVLLQYKWFTLVRPAKHAGIILEKKI